MEKGTFCSQCGNSNDITAKFCSACGCQLLKVNSSTNLISGDETKETSEQEELYKALIGGDFKAERYYLLHFNRFDKDGRTSITWHWPAFFITFHWLFYRKMWVCGILYYLLLNIGTLSITFLEKLGKVSSEIAFGFLIVWLMAAFLLPALYANALYYDFCRKRIARVRSFFPNEPKKQFSELQIKGGVSIVSLITGFLVSLIVNLIFFIIFR